MPPAMDSGAGITGEAFDGMPLKKPRLDAGDEPPPPASLWADIHPDILGVVLRLLPCLADRARVRSVCPRWRAAARNQDLPPPLPLLVLPKFRFSCLTSDMELTAPRCPLMPEEVAAEDAHYAGSYDGWVVGVTPIKVRRLNGELVYTGQMDSGCFLVNAFSHRVVHLPDLYSTRYIGALSCKILPVCNGTSKVCFEINGSYAMTLSKVVLSSSPDSGSKYIVAASSDDMFSGILGLWQPGMMSWHVCRGVPIDGPKDISFYQGKLYMFKRFIPRLMAFVLDEDDHGIIVSRVELCVTEPLPPHPMEQDGSLSCNMVVWHGNLLLVMRYYDSPRADRKIIKVQVFALDFSTNPYGLTRIHNFDGDCIFIGSGSSKSFPAGLHDEVEGDLIYFIPDYWSPYDRFVYNMRDGTMRPFSAKLLNFNGLGQYHIPVWLFPSE